MVSQNNLSSHMPQLTHCFFDLVNMVYLNFI